MSDTRVTDLRSRSSSDGLEVEITVVRDWRIQIGIAPDVNDVPADVRAALVTWLDGSR